MKKALIILAILLFCVPLMAQKQPNIKDSYFAIGLTVDNVTVADPIKVSLDGAWLLEVMTDAYIAPVGSFEVGDKSTPAGGVGAKIFYSDSDFGKFISVGTVTTFSKAAPDYDVITGMGFTARWSFAGVHPGFMINWVPTADGDDNEITLSLFGVF